MTKVDRSNRTAWHVLVKTVPIFGLIILGYIGYVVYKDVLQPMKADIEAIAEKMGVKPETN